MKLGAILLASSLAVPDGGSASTLTFNKENMNQTGRIDRDVVHERHANVAQGRNGYGVYTYAARSTWISFDVDPFTVQSGRHYALDVSLPGAFTVDGKRPARQPDGGVVAMYFLTDGITGAAQSGAGMLHRQSKVSWAMNMAPLGQNCCNSVLFSDTIFENGNRIKKVDRISAALMFSDMRNGYLPVEEFTVRGIGLRFLTAGNFAFASETLNVSHRALSGKYTFSPLQVPLPSSAWMALGSMAALIGGARRTPA